MARTPKEHKSGIPGCYRIKTGGYYLQYVYPLRIKNRLNLPSRLFRISLQTKLHHEAKRRSRLLLIHLDALAFDVCKEIDNDEARALLERGLNDIRTHPALTEDYEKAIGELPVMGKSNSGSVIPKEWKWEQIKQADEDVEATQSTENGSITFGQLAKLFLKEKEMLGGWSERTFKNRAAKVESVVEIVGSNVAVSDMDTHDAFRVRDLIYRYPKNRSKVRKIRDMSIEQIFKMKGSEYDPIDDQTANSYISIFRELCQFGIPRFYDRDITAGMAVKKVKKNGSKSRRLRSFATLSSEDLSRLFLTHYYTGSGQNKKIAYTKDKFWIPIIATYTGARVGEIIQLRVGDVKFSEEHSLWYLDLNDSEGNRLKTENSRRWIPIHSKLIELGFIEFARCSGEPSAALFDEIVHFGVTDDTNSFSKWFERTMRKEADWSSARKQTFHSFRHTFIDNLRRVAGVPDWQIASIVGHLPSEEGLTTVGYGSHELTLSDKKGIVERLNYDVDFSHLSWDKYKSTFLSKKKRA